MADEARDLPTGHARLDRRLAASERPEQRGKRRIAVALIALFLLMIVGIIVAGYVIIFVLPPRQVVVRVDDVQYTRGDMVKLLRVRQKSVEFLGGQFNYGVDVFQALQLLVENEMIAQSAPRFGITVSDDEVDANIRQVLAPDAGVAVGKEPAQIEREFRETHRSYLNAIQLSEAEHRSQVRRTLLRERFRQFIGDSVPTVAEQVRLHRLVVSPGDEVDIMQVKLKDAIGDDTEPEKLQEAFKQIVREFSRDTPEAVRKGGDLGWVPKGIHQDYDYGFFDLEIGQLSEGISNVDNPQQTLFFMISDREAARELNPRNRNTLKTRALQDWLNKERANHDVYAVFNSHIYDWVVEQLKLTTSRTPEPQRNPLGL